MTLLRFWKLLVKTFLFLQKDIAGVVSTFDNLKGMVEGNLSQYQDFQQYMLNEQKETGDLFNKAKTFQQVNKIPCYCRCSETTEKYVKDV